MDTTTSIKMTTLAIQNLFSYVEEENLSALKAHLDRFKEVDGRSDVCNRAVMVAALTLQSEDILEHLSTDIPPLTVFNDIHVQFHCLYCSFSVNSVH